MILTVTLNTAIDEVLVIDQFFSGQDMAIKKKISCVGGKGLNSSVALSGLRVETTGLAFMAGETGQTLTRIVEQYGIHPEIIWTGGNTRVCYVVSESQTNLVSHLKTGALIIDEKHLKELKDRMKMKLPGAEWVVLAGSVPPGISSSIYGELIEISHKAGKPVLIDCWGEPLLKSLAYQPDVVKMNIDEFNLTFDKNENSVTGICKALSGLIQQYQLKSFVITCGENGLVAQTLNAGYHVQIPRQRMVNAAGAGDAASAALAWRFSVGDHWPTALKWAGAVSAASVLTEATGEVRLSDTERLFPLVEVTEIVG